MRTAAIRASSSIARKVATTQRPARRGAASRASKSSLEVERRSRARARSITASMRSRTVTVSTSTSCGAPLGGAPRREHAGGRPRRARTARPRARAPRPGGALAAPAPRGREHVAPEERPLAELLGRLLEALVLEQPRDQLGARIAPPRPPSVARSGGSSMRDLIQASVAAISRYSPATSRSSSRISVEVLEVLLGDRARSGCR